MRLLIVLLGLLASTAAFSQTTCTEAITSLTDCIVSDQLSLTAMDWSTLAAFGSGFLVIGTLFLRFIAEMLGFIANKTSNTWDNKLVKKLKIAINFLAKVISLFGFGKARMVK